MRSIAVSDGTVRGAAARRGGWWGPMCATAIRHRFEAGERAAAIAADLGLTLSASGGSRYSPGYAHRPAGIAGASQGVPSWSERHTSGRREPTAELFANPARTARAATPAAGGTLASLPRLQGPGNGKPDHSSINYRDAAQMRYWWVNQNQTYRHEVQGGYLWSPKRDANGARNPFYESMREVTPGDLILSFMNTRILAIGIAQSYCWESPKPLEFGNSGQNWENVGWRVKVHFAQLANKIRPKDHIEILKPLLPDRYSPLQPNGNGMQSVYLTEVPTPLAEVLIGLIGNEIEPIARSADAVMPVSADDLDTWERKLEQG